MIELEARHQGDQQFARTLARGLALLGCFTPGEPMLRNKDFVQRTALDKVTVSRLTYTLVELGYLRRDAAAGGYRLGAAVLCLGYPLLASMTLRQKLRPAIREFAETVRGSVGMSLRDRMRMVYFEVVRAEHPSAPPLDVGASFPIVSSATGRAWLAVAPATERDGALNLTKVHEPALYADRIDDVRQARRRFADEGYCTSPGTQRADRLAVAVPMRGPINAETVVVTAIVTVRGRSIDTLQRRLGTRLVDLVRSLEASLDAR